MNENYTYSVKNRGVENELSLEEKRAITLGMGMAKNHDVFPQALLWVVDFYETKVKGGEAMGMPTQFDVRRAEAVKELANTLGAISKEESASTLKRQD